MPNGVSTEEEKSKVAGGVKREIPGCAALRAPHFYRYLKGDGAARNGTPKKTEKGHSAIEKNQAWRTKNGALRNGRG